MAGRDTVLMVTSDLGRTRATGASIGSGEPLAEWREFDLGAWDGMQPEEIRRRYPDITSERFGSGDFQPEGGERFSDFTERVRGAFEALAARIDEGEEAIAVTHGGVIQTIVGSIVGTADQSAMLVPSNASLTTIRLSDDRVEVFSLNDDLHLEGDVARPSGTRLRFIRHGETEANLEHRWWGRGESQLSDEGRRQAAALARQSPVHTTPSRSSPSVRARDTAAAVARDDDTVRIVDDLVELHFGEWEGLTGAEARATDPEAFRRIFEEGRDEPRGGTGETFANVPGNGSKPQRLRLPQTSPAPLAFSPTVGVTRAYVARLLGIPFLDRNVIPIPRNTAHCEVIYGGSGPRISSYNVAAHLGD